MLPLLVGSGILSLLFGKGKDKKLEAEKRGIERAVVKLTLLRQLFYPNGL